MNRYYIDHSCGNYTAPIEYAEKSKEEMLDDILYYIEEGKQSPFETIAEFDSKTEAEAAFNKCYDAVRVLKNGKEAVINYDIYRLEVEDDED